jgi:putative nucleotidyltransferase with HDIG domain
MDNEKIKIIEGYVKNLISQDGGHDFLHSDRVRNWALRIAQSEGFTDLEIVEMAALLHDIGTSQASKTPTERRRHGEIGAEIAEKFLAENNLLPPEKIAEVCNAIKFHNKNRVGEGRLLDIIRDADMMDLFGAVGVMRGFLFESAKPPYDPENVKSETWGMTVKDFDRRFDVGVGIGRYAVDDINFQISCYENLATATAKRLAAPLIEIGRSFLLELEREILASQNNIND